jgi:hypothetical protein
MYDAAVAGRLPPWPPGDHNRRSPRAGAYPWPVTDVWPVPEEPVCSARGCRAPAAWQLRWNNPRLHTADRRKTWLACPEHRGTLGEFLTRRGFLREVVAFPSSPTLDL